MDVKNDCNDCGNDAADISASALARGSMVREPGEPLCPGCSSTRVLMLRAVERLPSNLADIKAKRVPAVRKMAG